MTTPWMSSAEKGVVTDAWAVGRARAGVSKSASRVGVRVYGASSKPLRIAVSCDRGTAL
jgi:hypothetical protein